MGFFDSIKNRAFAAGSDDNTGTGDVEICYNAESVKVPAEAAAGKTLRSLYEQFADVLGIDPGRISSVFNQGRIVDLNTAPVAGNSYRANATSEEKG
jgi:hypothetical protein